MALHHDVIAELEAASAANRKSADAPAQHRINALESRIAYLEAVPRASAGYDEKFWAEVTKTIREFVESHVNKLKAENVALASRVKLLEDRPPLKYHGAWTAGKTYVENSLVTKGGCLWIAKQTTAAYPSGQAEPDSWQLCVKCGRDGKDAATTR
jgi:hypothetical protein